MPQWYRLLKAAEALHVPPWELLEREQIWMEWALAARYAEGKAREAHQKKAAHAAKRRK